LSKHPYVLVVTYLSGQTSTRSYPTRLAREQAIACRRWNQQEWVGWAKYDQGELFEGEPRPAAS
jgi:hypothetical protein